MLFHVNIQKPIETNFQNYYRNVRNFYCCKRSLLIPILLIYCTVHCHANFGMLYRQMMIENKNDDEFRK